MSRGPLTYERLSRWMSDPRFARLIEEMRPRPIGKMEDGTIALDVVGTWGDWDGKDYGTGCRTTLFMRPDNIIEEEHWTAPPFRIDEALKLEAAT